MAQTAHLMMTSSFPHSPLLEASDKSFWHGFTSFYDRVLPETMSTPIVEFGVFHGHSIRWLLERYPVAKVYGVDILHVQPEWPRSERVEYRCVDQSNETAVSEFFRTIPRPGMIIEDGSHIPSHQARCLRLGLKYLLPRGIYVLEDIHSSHPQHELYKEEFIYQSPPKNAQHHPTVLSLLLCFEHLLRAGVEPSPTQLSQFATAGFMSESDVVEIFKRIKRIEFFRRATLPTRCYSCNSTNFNYIDFRCECGVDLMKVADSMTVLIESH